METSLHRQLKQLYADGNATQEERLGDFRIDVVRRGELIEIQHGSLSAIRRKVERLLPDYRVRVVKPLIVRKYLVQCESEDGPVVRRRLSPKRGSILSLFDELIYFTRVFPHRHLTLETPLVEIEEWRYPGHGRRRWWKRNDFVIADQKLVQLLGSERFRTPGDLLRLIPNSLPKPFHTGHLAELMGIRRWIAQRMTYCLRHCGAIRVVGKQGNAQLYAIAAKRRVA